LLKNDRSNYKHIAYVAMLEKNYKEAVFYANAFVKHVTMTHGPQSNMLSDGFSTLFMCNYILGNKEAAKKSLKLLKKVEPLCTAEDKKYFRRKITQYLSSESVNDSTFYDPTHCLLKKCSYVECKNVETKYKEFKCCVNCQICYYCCKDCQVKDWRLFHKEICRL